MKIYGGTLTLENFDIIEDKHGPGYIGPLTVFIALVDTEKNGIFFRVQKQDIALIENALVRYKEELNRTPNP